MKQSSGNTLFEIPSCDVEPEIKCVHYDGALCRMDEDCGIVRVYRENNQAKTIEYKIGDADV